MCVCACARGCPNLVPFPPRAVWLLQVALRSRKAPTSVRRIHHPATMEDLDNAVRFTFGMDEGASISYSIDDGEARPVFFFYSCTPTCHALASLIA